MPTPEELVASAQRAQQQAQEKSGYEQAIRVEADALLGLVGPANAAAGRDVWLGPAAESCREDLRREIGEMQIAHGELMDIADELRRAAQRLDQKATADRAAAVQQYDEAVAEATRNGLPPPPRPPGL